MKITVAVPCYNGAAYVARTIEHLLNQSRPPDEIIIVDDGSTDESVEIIRQYQVKLVQHKRNKGLSAARNTAIAEATGEILAFIDVDAFADQDWLKVLLGGYDNDGHVGGVGGQGIEVKVHSLADRWRKVHASQGHGDIPKDVEFLFGLCMSFRLDALHKVGGFNEAFRTNGEDLEIGIRLNAAGYRLRYLPEAKVYHQRTDDVISLQNTMMAWYASAYRAKYVTRYHPWRVFAGTLQRVIVDPLSDLIFRYSPAMAWLSCKIGWKKLYALWHTARELKS